MPDGDSVTAYNGHEGWLGTPGRPVREMHGSDLDGASMDADLHFATHLKQMFSELRAEGSEKVGDRKAYVVVGRRERKATGSALFRRAIRIAGAPGALRRYGFGTAPDSD